jgi:hypothetical protein
MKRKRYQNKERSKRISPSYSKRKERCRRRRSTARGGAPSWFPWGRCRGEEELWGVVRVGEMLGGGFYRVEGEEEEVAEVVETSSGGRRH